MTQERFSILQNGIDSRLEIIRDNETGFYNITKTAKMIAKLSKFDATGYPVASYKLNKPAICLSEQPPRKRGGLL